MTSSKTRLATLSSRRVPLASAESQLAALNALPLAEEFSSALQRSELWPLRARTLGTMQVNLGKVCNQTCRHCHVDAGPDRRESMSRETMDACLRVLRTTDIETVDITGGAPEMHPDFRWFVGECRNLGKHVIDRSNLTILETGPHRDLIAFLAEHDVEVISSLPHYRELSTDRQRGDGVFAKSLSALRRLNAAGYGEGDPSRRLVIVSNPVGAFLPGNQASLEGEWKREMWRRYEIRFDALFTITNMPISRYLEWLQESGNTETYLEALVKAYNPEAARGVMCRDLISVGWDGVLYDCDFNQMLEMPVAVGDVQHIQNFSAEALQSRAIEVGRHCYGCTAGAGSSCGGTTA